MPGRGKDSGNGAPTGQGEFSLQPVSDGTRFQLWKPLTPPVVLLVALRGIIHRPVPDSVLEGNNVIVKGGL